MSVAVNATDPPRQGIEQPTREIHCPKCRRFLGLRVGDAMQTSVRIYCRNCRRLVCADDHATPVRRHVE